MPLHWSIDSRLQLVTAVAEGPVSRADAHSYIDAVSGAGAGRYRKLFDARDGTLAMDADDLLEIGARIRGFHGQPIGPLALLLPEDQLAALSRLLGVLASADRPMRLFKTKAPAQKWLDGFGAGAAQG